MNGNEYQKLAERTMNKHLSKEDVENHALFGMCGEVGELQSIYQKIYQGHKFNEDHAKKEVGDLLWFIAEYCTVHNWKLEDVMQLNIDKLAARYPDGFSEYNSTNRAEDDI